ncbi:hypothetical protein [Pseudomonas sp. PP3]|uniref:hypothetical protein n=1 Tax=Pseudomonas sp. PP3 TaxID=2815936 RepID=UPI001BAFD44F|nr:hypothetical protein [Pseudomonas sp. PP3]
MNKADIRQIAGPDLFEGRKSAITLQLRNDKARPATLDIKRLAGVSTEVARALRYNEQRPAVAQLEKTNPSSAGGFAIEVSRATDGC